MRSRPLPLFILLALLGAALPSARPALASWGARYYLFDRAVWSPDSRSVAVIGRYTNADTGESLEDTLLIDARTGRYLCISPSATRFVLSRDGSRILALGRWGLYDYEVAKGRTGVVHSIDSFQRNEIATFSYDRNMEAAICLRCSDEYPESSGVYSYPLAGGAATLLLPDPLCGPQALNYWQSHRRDVSPTGFSLPTPDNPTVIEKFPGTLRQLKNDTLPAVAVTGNGTAPADTLCRSCRVEFNSWPPGGGLALVSTAPENINDVLTPGDLWLLEPSRPTRHLARGRFEQVAWKDSVTAYAMARPGILWGIDVPSGTAYPISMSLAPQWLKSAPGVAPARVWTLRLDDEVYADPDSARNRALSLRDAGVAGYGLDALPDRSGYVLSVGTYPDSLAAVKAMKLIDRGRGRGHGTPPGMSAQPGGSGQPGHITVQRRAVSAMLGQFEFGSLESPDGRSRLYFRSHPHMFQPYTASEVWLQAGDGARPRLAIAPMANF